MSAMASQITSLTIVHASVYSGADQRKHQSSASLTFVRGIHHWPMNSPHKGLVTRKMFPFDDVIMFYFLGRTHIKKHLYFHALYIAGIIVNTGRIDLLSTNTCILSSIIAPFYYWFIYRYRSWLTCNLSSTISPFYYWFVYLYRSCLADIVIKRKYALVCGAINLILWYHSAIGINFAIAANRWPNGSTLCKELANLQFKLWIIFSLETFA